jgi:ATP-dependent DNA ligase
MRLLRIPKPFDQPDFVYEVKHDGFRALAYVEQGGCQFVSRKGYTFKAWPQLADEIARTVRCGSAVLDGEICCLKADGRSNFYRLMFRRDRPFFYGFDVLAIDDEDLTASPLVERKRRLRAILPRHHSRLYPSMRSRSAGRIYSDWLANGIWRVLSRSGLRVPINTTGGVRPG